MALVVGTNCGFVSVRPTAAVTETKVGSFDEYHFGFRCTSPAGNNRITEIGVYVQNLYTGFTGNSYKVSLYSDSSDLPGTEQTGFPKTGQSTTTDTPGWYIYSGINFTLSPSTLYWLTAGHVTTTGRCDLASATSTGDKGAYHLYANKPSIAIADCILAIYALYEAIATGPSIPLLMANYRRRRL